MSIRIFRHHVYLPVALLFLLELAAAVCAIHLASAISHESLANTGDVFWPAYVIYCSILMLCLMAMGLHNVRMRERLSGIALRLVLAATVTAIALLLLAAAVPGLLVGPIALFEALLASVVVGLLLRTLGARIMGDQAFKRRVLIYGAGRQAQRIANLRRRTDRAGFVIVGFVATPCDMATIDGGVVLEIEADLRSTCRAHDVDEIVVAMDDRRREFPIHELLQCRLDGIEVTELIAFLERETGKVRLDVLNPSWMIFSDGFRRSVLRDFVGRLVDVVASLVLLSIAWPLMLLTILAIKLEGGWRASVLYRQRRVGFEGRVFELLKFRSMQQDAEADGIARWAKSNDSRVTRVGEFIRKSRIDELPQLFNVLRGDMRFVGPRPERPEFVERLANLIPYYRERHCVRPGLTGWAQLCYPYGASEKDATEKLQYDLYYVKNRTTLLDLAIVIQTVEVILFRKGAR